jgi:hypothetical protein
MVWSLPFNLVMKLEQEQGDQLEPAKPIERGWDVLLNWVNDLNAPHRWARTRVSMWREAIIAMRYPYLLPEIFGVLFSFGETLQHPSVIITERVDTLSAILGDNDEDFQRDSLCINPKDGRLRIVDSRLTNASHHEQCAGCFSIIFPDSEDVTDVRNVGMDSEGRLVLLDGGNYFSKGFRMPGASSRELTIQISRLILKSYRECRSIWHSVHP